MHLKKATLLSLSLFFSLCAYSQFVPQITNSKSIYEFLDEMANAGQIELISAVKPYSRELVFAKLGAIDNTKLNKRQREELEFYLKDFIKENTDYQSLDYVLKGVGQGSLALGNRDKRYDLFFYKDSVFTFSINPILGGSSSYNENGFNYYSHTGGSFFAKVGKFGMYGLMIDQHEDKLVSDSSYLTPMQGAFYKSGGKTGARDYSDARGGITFANKWISVGVMKETLVWGDNYNGANIYSGRNPSFPFLMLKIHPVKWFEFNYIHGWLSSNVVDSVSSTYYPTGPHEVYVSKYIAANMFTFRPLKSLYLSFGNSIIYDQKPYLGYFIPFVYFKSLDHNSSRNGNAQLFVNFSSRQIKNNHLYFTWYVDELSFRRMLDSKQHTNWWSIKGGWRWTNFVPNVSFTAEYTRNNPMVYKHYIPTTTYESTGFNMGHYLRDNSQEIYLSVDWKPIRRFKASINYLLASKGPDYVDNRVEKDSTGTLLIRGLPFQSKTIWRYNSYGINLQYQWIHDLWVEAGYKYLDVRDDNMVYTPAYYRNSTHNFKFGLRLGF